MVAGPEITAKLTGKPEEAVALSMIGATPYVWLASVPKLIVCASWTVVLKLTLLLLVSVSQAAGPTVAELLSALGVLVLVSTVSVKLAEAPAAKVGMVAVIVPLLL